MRRATRRSVNTVFGRMPALRPRLPGTVPSMKHAACKKPVGEYFDATGASPQESTPVPAGTTFGRSVFEPKSKLVSDPVRTAKGRPELNSTIGATVQSLKRCRRLPLTFPD